MSLLTRARQSKRRPVVESLETRALLSALSVSLTTSQSVYQPGQPIPMTFTETNISSQPVKVEEGPSMDGFVVTQNSNIVWQSNAGANPLYIVVETLEPGQSLTLHATWNGSPSQGQTPIVAGGTFTVTNQLDPEGASATFQIEPALSTSVTTDKSAYQVGQPVQMKFVATNTSAFPITVSPSGTFSVANSATGVAVFSQSVGQNAVVTLQPGQSLSHTATWTATQPGSYGLKYQNGEVGADGTFQVVQASSPPAPPVQNPQPVTGGNGTPVQNPQPVTATLTTNRPEYGAGQPVVITLTLKNTSDHSVSIAPNSLSDGFSVLSGSTNVWQTARNNTRAARAKARTLLPGQSVTFQTVWNGKPSSRGVKKLSAGSYTVLASEGGYSAGATIQIA